MKINNNKYTQSYHKNMKINNNNNIQRCTQELSKTPVLKWPGPSHVHIMFNTSESHHEQHVMCHLVLMVSLAIEFDMCHMVQRVSLAIEFDMCHMVQRVSLAIEFDMCHMVQRVSLAIEFDMCHMVQRVSLAIKFDKVEVAFISALVHWLKPSPDEGGEELVSY